MKNPFLVYIHGGTTFKKKRDYINYLKNKEINLEETKNWSGDYLKEELNSYFQIICPRMPCKEKANYFEWKIIFEKYLDLLKKEKKPLLFLGYSLGSIFLVKYFSENKVNLKILSIHLVAPPFDKTNSIEELSGGFKLKKDLSLLKKQIKNIYFYFSENDEIVPLYYKKRYQEQFLEAKFFVFKDKNGHFRVEKFPELIKNLKKF
ncbi:MAG: hypothetical protein N2593_02860 [Patescibacteria group bacterium]|nr:hypothetical protein [Patescibacteria group bacterium]